MGLVVFRRLPGTVAMRRAAVIASFTLLAAATPLAAQRRPVPAPASVLGFVPGADRKLVEWARIVAYFR